MATTPPFHTPNWRASYPAQPAAKSVSQTARVEMGSSQVTPPSRDTEPLIEMLVASVFMT